MSDTIWIRSTVDPETRKAACLVTWGPLETILAADVVLATARDLVAAAAAAETDIALIRSLREDLKADDTIVGMMLGAVRRRRPVPTASVALRIEAVAGAKTGKPYVHIARGSQKAPLDPDDARTMADHWTQAAMAAHNDVRLRYVLGDFHQLTPADTNEIFLRLQKAQR
ncbi:hypothetical protein ACIP96_06435 [Streptomyces nigra]|uniref:hypothetical protein n=1 Tax=Streptomyces nigra TaxID=1827580 RepID=UPI0037F478A2